MVIDYKCIKGTTLSNRACGIASIKATTLYDGTYDIVSKVYINIKIWE